MFEILRKSVSKGIVTAPFPPDSGDGDTHLTQGRPKINLKEWKDARNAASACPTGAITISDSANLREVTLDLGKCTFCGLCAEADEAIQMTTDSELAANRREDLISIARYNLATDGTHREFASAPSQAVAELPGESIQSLGAELKRRIQMILRRSLHIREVDAGSCNGCEVEIVGLNNPIYDIERFGIHFVASPRHADMLLVTGPVSRNMELALRKTYEATPAPRLVVAVGACGCSGGIFGQNYATVGGVDKVIPVDVFVPGCPPSPYALLKGILLAVGRL